MASLILDENLEAAIECVCQGDKRLRETSNKISSVLKSYAVDRKTSYTKLRVMDVATDGGEINPEFLRFLQTAPRRRGQTERRHRRYQSENSSRLGALISEITGIPPKGKGDNAARPVSIILDHVPAYLLQVLDKFPIVSRFAAKNINGDSDRLKIISKNGLLLLLALCRVARDKEIADEGSPLKILLLDHYHQVRAELRSLAWSNAEFQNLDKAYGRFVKSVGLKRDIPPPARLQYKDWPQPFRDQYDTYLGLVTGKVRPSQALLDSASRHEFSLRTYCESTTELFRNVIAGVLPIIPYGEALDIVDLIRLEPTEIEAEEGTLVQKRNGKIDDVRDIERSKSKTAGCDTERFRSFLSVIKAIAARNGYGYLIKDFNETYQCKTDVKARRAKKAAKKQGIKRKWFDDDLERLCVEFDRVVDQGLFERKPGRKNRDADRAMRLCLFTPQALTLRRLGYRQQAIRGSVLGVNIKFLRGGVVVLHFNAEEVKNSHALHMVLKPTRGGTHERLRKVLIKYHSKVWPYMRRQGGTRLGQHFFACFDGNSGRFRQFISETDYACFFKRRAREFMNLHQLEPHLRNSIHPHFLRGMCADWIVIDLEMSKDDAAEVLGNTRQVLERDYLDEEKVYDATPIFDKANAALRAKRNVEGGTDSGLRGRKLEIEYQKNLSAKDKQIEVLTDALALAKEQYGEKIASLEAQLVAQSAT